MIELLAPAGSLEKMKFAFKYGADACYLGVPDFSLRARLNEFTIDSVKESIRYAHSINKKVYVTFNIVAHNHHIKKFIDQKKEISEFLTGEDKPDAVIVSDLGVFSIIKEFAPEMEIHISTQANVINYKAIDIYRQLGANRIIMGREATLNDLKIIKENNSGIDIEYFVHGAMCMAYSGRCFLSKYFAGSSANLGACVHPCRWGYKEKEIMDLKNGKANKVEEDRRDIFGNEREIILTQDDNGTYFFNSHDLCLIEYLKDLKDVGVISLKVEGRTKSIYYIAQVIKAYRSVLDLIDSKEYDDEKKYWKEELNKLVNRGYITGFLLNEAKSDPSSIEKSHLDNEYRFVGEVVKFEVLKKYHEDIDKNLNFVFVHNKINKGDVVEIIPIKGRNFDAKIKRIIDPNNLEEIQTISAGFDKIVGVEFEEDVKLEDMVLMIKKEIK